MKYIILMVLFSIGCNAAIARELTEESVNGSYHLGTAERGKNQVLMQIGKLANKTVIAVAGCKQCPPAVYTLQQEPSKTLGIAIFMTSGLYLIPYGEDSFILVQPDAVLGRKVWTKIAHANIYSKSKDTASNTKRADIERFAIDLSNKIMNQEVGEMVHSAGQYFLAMPQKHAGKSQSSYEINFMTSGKKSIVIKPCEGCSESEYQHLPEESGVIGVDVYRNASSYYLFDLKDGVLIYTFANASGFGKTLWTKHSQYNVYSNNQAYIRQILTSKDKQNTIDGLMNRYFKEVKDYFELKAKQERQQRDANRELPNKGLEYTPQADLLTASQAWASAWDWKETIVDSYLTQSDWFITRNPLSGIITGKVIGGVAVMRHPDGRCRFQTVSFRKDFDGTDYMNLHVTGIGPIYDFSCDKLTE